MRVIQGAAATSKTLGAFSKVWEASPLIGLLGVVLSFGAWRGGQMLFSEPSVKADRSKRSTMFSVDEEQAAAWQKGKEARGDWWHMMDKARGAGGDAIFGDSSPQQTWAGKDRGTQVSFNDADYGQA